MAWGICSSAELLDLLLVNLSLLLKSRSAGAGKLLWRLLRMSKRPGLFTAQTREREPLPIVAPAELLGRKELSGAEVLVSAPCESEAAYLFCKSLIHVCVGGDVSTDSSPIDARGGSFIAVDRGAVLQVRLMDGEETANCWVHAVK